MEKIEIRPAERLNARVVLPASKSISNRALLINALSQSRLVPENVSDCDDTRVMLAALRNMPETIDIGAAGTAMRFLTAYLSVTDGQHVITGTERMRHRPIAILVDALRQLGAQLDYLGEEGFPPLRITGQTGLEGGEISLPGDVSSQYISALLMVAPVLRRGLSLELTGKIISRPYLDMTIAMMREFGAEVAWNGNNRIRVSPVPYHAIPYTIENDWSAASYWYEMVALSDDTHAEVVLPGLYAKSLQGDSRVADLFSCLGVETEFCTDSIGEKTVCLRKAKAQPAVSMFETDLTNQPDLAQTMVVTCAMLGVPFRLTGLQSLKIKETDRIAALRAELGKLGYEIGEENDSVLFWNGERIAAEVHPAIATYQDHRMAMAFAPVCLRTGQLCVQEPHVVSKSYPSFWKDLEMVGFSICN